MKQYIVEFYVLGQKIRQYVVNSYNIAQDIADYSTDDLLDVKIKEVELL